VSLSLQTFDFPEGGSGRFAARPDAFAVEVCPRSAATIACSRTRKLKGSGKPELTTSDGLQICDALIMKDLRAASAALLNLSKVRELQACQRTPGVARWHATSIYPASENSTGLMGSGRVRRHPHRRD
jgi:hypothetical protein